MVVATSTTNFFWPRFLAPGVVLVVLAHRLLLMGLYREEFGAFFAEQGDLQVYHFLPLPLLLAKPWTALLYLQQSPPLPSGIFTAICHVFSWPTAVSWVLVGFNGLIDALTAGLLAGLIFRVWQRPFWALALGLVFGLGPDLVILDYNVRGQSFYENLAMFLVLLSCRLVLALLDHSGQGPACILGLVTGLLALTRTSYSFYSVAVLILLLALPLAAKRRQLLVFAVVALLVQGSWSLKNWLVFEDWRWTTSTWGGANLAAGLVNLGYGPDLRRVILENAEEYPDFFLELVRLRVDFGFIVAATASDLPAELAAADHAIDERLLGQNRFQNQISQRIAYDHLAKAWLKLVAEKPAILLRKLKWSYKLYWFPTRYHPGQFRLNLSPLTAEARLAPEFMPWQTLLALGKKTPETFWLIRATQPEVQQRPVELFTADRLNILAWQLNLWLLHGLALPWALFFAWQGLPVFGRKPARELTRHAFFHLCLAWVFLYSALVHNLVEFGENMRFRLNAEPVIWLLSFSATLATWQLVKKRPATGNNTETQR